MKLSSCVALVIGSKFNSLIVHTSHIQGQKSIACLGRRLNEQQEVPGVPVKIVGSERQRIMQKCGVNTDIGLFIGFPFQVGVLRLRLCNTSLVYFIERIAEVIIAATVYIGSEVPGIQRLVLE